MAEWIVEAETIDDLVDGYYTIGNKLIRCRDCKWFGDFGCAIRIVDDSDKPTENDFCSFAERRTE